MPAPANTSAKSLSAAIVKRRAEFLDKLRQAKDSLEAAVERFDREMAVNRENVEERLNAYNTILACLRDLRDETVSDLEAVAEDKSDRWQESQAGQDHAAWVERLNDVELDDVEVEFPEEPLDVPPLDHDAAVEDEFTTEP